MKKTNSENLSNPKSIKNDEKTPQKENTKRNTKDESNIYLTPINISEEQEDNLDSYLKEDSNSNLCNEIESLCDNKGEEEPKVCENTDIKKEVKVESANNDLQQDIKTNNSSKLSLKKKKKKNNANLNIINISLYKQRIEKIIKRKLDFLFQKKKKYTKDHFFEILKVNNLYEYIEKIEFILNEVKSEYKDNVYDETDENNDPPDIRFKQEFANKNINEIINENTTPKMCEEDSTLVESTLINMNFHGIFTNSHSLSTENDEICIYKQNK